MTQEKIELLQKELCSLQQAADHLGYSLARCLDLISKEDGSPEQLERLESLTSRFARLSDLLTQRIFRLMDDLELTGASALLDRLYRAEKRGWAKATDLIKIRELRNLIAHEYAADKMHDIFATVAALTPLLLAVVPAVKAYAHSVIQRYPR